MKNWLKITAVIVFMAISITLCTAFSVASYQSNIAVQTAVVTAKSSASDIKLVQQKLKNWGYYKGSVDGIFGPQTKEAVKES